jgi:hypothetical protein
MKKVLIIILCATLQYGIAQTKDSVSEDDYERVYVEAGFVQPLGELSNKFELSPSFGFWFRTKMVEDDFIDFGFNFFIPKNPISPDFKYRNELVKYKSEYFAINIGTRFAKVVPLAPKSNNFNVEWNSGIGLALNFYNAPDELEFEGQEHTEEVLTTFYLSQGIKVNYKNVGLQCHYQWSPYGLFNDRIDNFGSQSVMFGIVYRQ